MDSDNRENNDDKKNNCCQTGRNKKDCPRCVEIKEYFLYEISDYDFEPY